MSYQSVFGGTAIYPSDPTYLAVTLGSNIELEWPLESNSPTYPAARIIDVTSSGAYEITGLQEGDYTIVGFQMGQNGFDGATFGSGQVTVGNSGTVELDLALR